MVHNIKAGDILFYEKTTSIETRLIEVGEILEDGIQQHEFYHVAVAIDAFNKIESNGKLVEINTIRYGEFSCFRPPIDEEHISKGLQATIKLEGQPFDKVLILDDVLRYLTFNFIHLPIKWINSQERRKKICSTLVAFYLEQAGWHTFKGKPSPEDIYLLVKDWPIKVQR